MMAIIGYSERLANNVSDAVIAEDAAVNHREASRLNRLVDDTRLVDRVDAGRVSRKMRPVDCNGFVRDVVTTFRPLTDSHHLLLDPSLRTIATGNDGHVVIISIGDEGIGIAGEDLSRIFDRFERVEAGIASPVAGTGLGLSIAQEIASLPRTALGQERARTRIDVLPRPPHGHGVGGWKSSEDGETGRES